MTRKWNIVIDNSKSNYCAGNKVIHNTEVLKCNLCDYNDPCILVRGDITIVVWIITTEVAFKSCAPFTKFITKIDETTIDDAENSVLVMPKNNLIEYSSNCSKATGTLWFYSKD